MYLLIAFCVALIVQFYFYLFLFRKFTTFKKNNLPVFTPAVSVVVCARNEAENLKRLLPALVHQDYPEFEIVLVDDGSTDQTFDIVKEFESSLAMGSPALVVTRLRGEESKGKKNALTHGINRSRFEYLLLTDADCVPAGSQWIREMIRSFESSTELVLGYGAYHKISGSVLNQLIRFETLLTALQYFSYALDGKAYMGVGRNLAYKRETFLMASGFSGLEQVKSGDDDLLVSKIATADNVSICVSPGSFTSSVPSADFRSWIRQKRRHITTAHFYRPATKITLGIFYLSQLMFYTLGFALLILGTKPVLVTSLIATRLVLWYTAIVPAARRLNEKDLIPFGPLYEISIIFIQLYIFLRNKMTPPKYW